MDEQRILDEMERMLAADDPRLAARLAAFGRPGLGHVLRTGRARATAAVIVVAVVVAVGVVVYLMSALRLGESLRPQPLASRSAQRIVPTARASMTQVSQTSATGQPANGGPRTQCATSAVPSYCRIGRTLVSAAATPER
jgi:DUF3040 family protein